MKSELHVAHSEVASYVVQAEEQNKEKETLQNEKEALQQEMEALQQQLETVIVDQQGRTVECCPKLFTSV